MGSETNRKTLAKAAMQKRKILCVGIAAFVALLPLLSKEVRSSIKARGDEYLGNPTYVQFAHTENKEKKVEPIDFIGFQMISVDFNRFCRVSMEFNCFPWMSMNFNVFP